MPVIQDCCQTCAWYRAENKRRGRCLFLPPDWFGFGRCRPDDVCSEHESADGRDYDGGVEVLRRTITDLLGGN